MQSRLGTSILHGDQQRREEQEELMRLNTEKQRLSESLQNF